MKQLLLFFLLPFMVQAQTIQQKADALLTAYYQQDLFTGNVLIAQKGKVVFAKSYGLANRANNKQVNAGTEFRIGSMSKPFTALLIMQLQEQGKLKLTDALSQYIPDYPHGDSITITNLLNHTSGIKSVTSLPAYQQDRGGFKNVEDMVALFKNQPLNFAPGSLYQYSNSNYILLSYIAQKAAGKTFDVLLQQAILKPLKMTQSGLDADGRSSTNKALGYEAAADDDYTPVTDNNIGSYYGSGSMYSTAQDLLKWDRALYGTTLISEASKTLMFTPGKGNYGLGWEINTEHGRKVISHSGSVEGFKANIIRFPESETCIIFLSNYFNTKGPQICEALTAITFNEPYQMPLKRTFVNLTEAALKEYEGTYQFNGAISMKIEARNGKLVSIIPGQPVVALKPQPADRFYVKSNDADIEFARDNAGKIITLKLVKGKQSMDWMKI